MRGMAGSLRGIIQLRNQAAGIARPAAGNLTVDGVKATISRLRAFRMCPGALAQSPSSLSFSCLTPRAAIHLFLRDRSETHSQSGTTEPRSQRCHSGRTRARPPVCLRPDVCMGHLSRELQPGRAISFLLLLPAMLKVQGWPWRSANEFMFEESNISRSRKCC